MSIKRIRGLETIVFKCQATVNVPQGDYWRKRKAERHPGRAIDKCASPASWEYQGNHWCTQHAGALALELWTEGYLRPIDWRPGE